MAARGLRFQESSSKKENISGGFTSNESGYMEPSTYTRNIKLHPSEDVCKSPCKSSTEARFAEEIDHLEDLDGPSHLIMGGPPQSSSKFHGNTKGNTMQNQTSQSTAASPDKIIDVYCLPYTSKWPKAAEPTYQFTLTNQTWFAGKSTMKHEVLRFFGLENLRSGSFPAMFQLRTASELGA